MASPVARLLGGLLDFFGGSCVLDLLPSSCVFRVLVSSVPSFLGCVFFSSGSMLDLIKGQCHVVGSSGDRSVHRCRLVQAFLT